MHRSRSSALPALLPALLLAGACAAPDAGAYDVVIAGGRVMDPESGLDGVRWVGIRDGRIAAISRTALHGAVVLDATGHVVSPGFIDLHAHGQDEDNYRLFALNGVTSALEMEVGTEDVAGWYAARAGRARLNHGVTVGHVRVRAVLFDDPGDFLPTGPGGRARARPEQIDELRRMLRRGLDEGALGVGFGIQYTPGATRWEILEMFREAAAAGATAFVHVRAFGPDEPGGSIESFVEVIGAAAITGAPLHIVHINSMSLGETPRTLRMVEEARARGMDITTEAYPYSAGLTDIQSALLDQYEGAPDSVLARLQWPATGEWLNRDSFRRYRRQGGSVVLHLNTPEMEAFAIESPITAIASDGGLRNGVGHPRTAGTYARVLGHYVRERGTLSLMDAIRKSALLPAERLQARAPTFRDRGRIRVGAWADVAVFDPETVADRATYAEPGRPAVGFRHVLVNGVAVVRDGDIVEGVAPGAGLRAGSE
jgi:N-acyl-D-aspartate/D-glutamate deacylase